MILDVHLAGHAVRWRFRGSGRLQELLDRGDGGVFVLRSTAGLVDRVAETLRREVAARQGEREAIRIVTVDARLPGASLMERLDAARRPGHDSDLLGYELTSTIVEWLVSSRTVIIASMGDRLDGAMASAAARELHDWTTKCSQGAPATFFLIETRDNRCGSDPVDLTLGLPIDPILGNLRLDISSRWRAFLHARVAWEAAGNPDRAHRWCGPDLLMLADEDEVGLERALNSLAMAEYRELSRELRGRLESYLRMFMGNPRSRADLLQLCRDLEDAQLLWSPRPTGWPQVVPWAARAILKETQDPVAKPMLLGAVAHVPLLQELLGRCLELESRERALCWAHRTERQPAPPAEAKDRYQRFRSDPGHVLWRFYPQGSPVMPTDCWPFCTFGEFLDATQPSSLSREPWHQLRSLRNALAHGHSAGWKVIQHLVEIEHLLEP